MLHFRIQSRPNKLFEAIRDRDWTKVTKLCKEQPRLAKSWARVKLSAEAKESTDVLPLHVAVLIIMADDNMIDNDNNQTNNSEESAPSFNTRAIQELIKAYPQALACKEGSLKRTPLHLACQGREPSASLGLLIDMLLESYPDAARELDQYNRLPLHYACANTNNQDVIEDVLKAYPEAVDLRDGQGWLPLHVACHYATDVSIIQLLLRSNADAVIAITPMDRESPLDLIRKQTPFKDQHEIMDLLAAKEKYYKPTPRPYLPSFVSDNVVKPIY